MHVDYCTCKVVKSTVYLVVGKLCHSDLLGFSAGLISTNFKEIHVDGTYPNNQACHLYWIIVNEIRGHKTFDLLW